MMRLQRPLAFIVAAFTLLTVLPGIAGAQERSSTGTSAEWYIGLLGAGVSMTSQLARQPHLNWGVKVEGGYLPSTNVGVTMQGLLRLYVPISGRDRLFLQGGIGALLSTDTDHHVDPWGSVGIGARIQNSWGLLLQYPGFPVVGIMFPL